MSTIITARVEDQSLLLLSVPKIASGGANERRVEVLFDDSWRGYGKTAIFYRNKSKAYHVVMIDDTCTIPHEVLAEAGRIYFGIMGVSGSVVRTTEVVALAVSQGAITGVQAVEPLPDVYQQLLSTYGLTTQKIAVASARIDNLVTGGTAAGSEVVDIRVGYDGKTHSSAGAAVREQVARSQTASGALEAAMSVVPVIVEHERITDMSFGTNSSGGAKLVTTSGSTLTTGTIRETGLYDLSELTLLTTNTLNTSEHLAYLSYNSDAQDSVYIEAGTKFYLTGTSRKAPRLKVPYIPGQIVQALSWDEAEYNADMGETIEPTEIPGLLDEGTMFVNTGSSAYTLFCFPVESGACYRLTADSFAYPSANYHLFGFVKTLTSAVNHQYIPGDVSTNPGRIDILLRAPISGYMVVSNATSTPTTFGLTKVTALNKKSNVKRWINAHPYNKLLTIGDSLSGNSNLWQPVAIDLLNIPKYGTLGRAGLTVSDQGADAGSIYNFVMDMTADESVDLITFWGGFNDYNANVALSTMAEQLDRSTRDAGTFYGGLLDCVEKILTVYPTKQLVLIGTTPFYMGSSWHVRTNSKGHKIADYVAAVKEVAEYFSVPFLDLLRTSGFNEYNYPTYYLDQGYWLHPNATGNALIGRKIAGFVKSLNGEY